MKKEFTAPRPKKLDELSDIELIEVLDRGTSTNAEINTINAILNKRMKRTIQFLTEVFQKNADITEVYNKKLVNLTIAIAILTFLMLIGLIIQIWGAL